MVYQDQRLSGKLMQAQIVSGDGAVFLLTVLYAYLHVALMANNVL
jgi:hypothetical protein